MTPSITLVSNLIIYLRFLNLKPLFMGEYSLLDRVIGWIRVDSGRFQVWPNNNEQVVYMFK